VVTEPDVMAGAAVEDLASAGDDAMTALPRTVPPSFAPFVAVLGLLKTFDWQEDFLFDYRTGTAMFGEQSIEFHRPLTVGQSVAITAVVTDVYEKQGKQMFDVVEVTFDIKTGEEGELLMSGQQSYILFK
jgi:hydroxyacyl-ACP dehydratase HTD2-like protein with hotdog domain